MPKYKYKAQDEKGKSVTGVMQAANQEELHVKLREDHKFLLSAQETDGSKRVRALKAMQLSEFSRQIGTLVGSGVSLVRTLNIICQEESLKPWEKGIYTEILRLVRQGVALSDAMESQNGVFPALMVNMYRSAEAGGNLDKTAMRMSIHYEKEYRLNSKVKSSMVYPKILGFLIVAVVIIIMTYVIPQFQSMFDQMESLPITTVALLAISDFIAGNWLPLLLGAIGVFLVGSIVMRIPKVKWQKDKIMLRLPIFGKLLKIIYTARFSRTLSSMYSSGIPIVTCLQIAKKTVGNTYIEGQFDNVIVFIRGGGNLSEGLDMVDGFSKKLISSIYVGEETGSLDAMLDSIADNMDYESEQAINKMVSYLEPAMIVVMAVVVGFIMVSVIQPIYGSYETIGAQ